MQIKLATVPLVSKAYREQRVAGEIPDLSKWPSHTFMEPAVIRNLVYQLIRAYMDYLPP